MCRVFPSLYQAPVFGVSLFIRNSEEWDKIWSTILEKARRRHHILRMRGGRGKMKVRGEEWGIKIKYPLTIY